MIKLSIAIPTFERKDLLLALLLSLKKQLRHDVEVIVSDNGSSDGTLNMLKELEIPQLKVIGFEKNRGIDANIVNVIQHASGEYIFLFSDDDVFKEGLLEQILSLLDSSYDVIVLNHYGFTQDPHKPLTPCFLPQINRTFSCGEKFFRYVGLGFLSSLIFKKQQALLFISKVRFGKECAHVDIVARIALEPAARCFLAGELVVAARALALPRYSMMNSCVIFLNELYEQLYKEKKLSLLSLTYFQNRLVFKEIPRIYYKLLLQKTCLAKIALEEAYQVFKEKCEYRLFLLVLLQFPQQALVFFEILHTVILKLRKYKLNKQRF
jgi:glycosyltransferase involved in cell wall biosynthesis